MISHDLYVQIRYLTTVEQLSAKQIAQKLNLAPRTVRNWRRVEHYPEQLQRERERLIEKFGENIRQMLQEFPELSGVQVYQRLCKIGYEGSISNIRRYLRTIRPKEKRAFLALSFEPGEAMQVDFGHCGYLRQQGKQIRLCICAMVLCHSRFLYAELIPSEKLEHTLACLQNALRYFGGAPRKIIVDNFKGAVLFHGRHGEVRFNTKFLDFSAHFGLKPVACNVRSPQEKGRIENAIGYIKGNFISGNRFSSLEEAQHSLREWLDSVANVRIHGTTRRQPYQMFHEEERPALQVLNQNPFDCARLETRASSSQCRVQFEGNSYSVPSRFASQQLHLRITSEHVLIYHENTLIASHRRNYGNGHTIADPTHWKLLLEERNTAKQQNMKADFISLGPDAVAMLQMLEERVLNPEPHLKRILLLTDIYGPDRVREALQNAVQHEVYGADYIEYIIRLQNRPKNETHHLLHVPNAGEHLDLSLKQVDFDDYNIQ